MIKEEPELEGRKMRSEYEDEIAKEIAKQLPIILYKL